MRSKKSRAIDLHGQPHLHDIAGEVHKSTESTTALVIVAPNRRFLFLVFSSPLAHHTASEFHTSNIARRRHVARFVKHSSWSTLCFTVRNLDFLGLKPSASWNGVKSSHSNAPIKSKHGSIGFLRRARPKENGLSEWSSDLVFVNFNLFASLGKTLYTYSTVVLRSYSHIVCFSLHFFLFFVLALCCTWTQRAEMDFGSDTVVVPRRLLSSLALAKWLWRSAIDDGSRNSIRDIRGFVASITLVTFVIVHRIR